MRNTVQYEWLYEHTDIHGDIHDHDHANTYAELMRVSRTIEGLKGNVVLVRNEGNENEGLTHKSWAYLKDGKLPACFSDAFNCELPNMKVPQKFIKQVK